MICLTLCGLKSRIGGTKEPGKRKKLRLSGEVDCSLRERNDVNIVPNTLGN